MSAIEKAIESGYQDQISSLYQVLSQSILIAEGDAHKIKEAEERFKEGLEFAADVRKRARTAAKLD